ncbi:MAG: NADH-quinone oxidoreductase subunit C [Anaerolineae bacterium]|nr:NADH-quinone oxidoreductase subunit C [Anaerolineae bacterium]
MSDIMAIANTIREQFPQAVMEIIEFRGDVTVVIDRAALVEVAAFCRDADGLRFNLLSDLCGIDYWPEEPRFAVSYVLYSLPFNHTIRFKVYAPGKDPVMPTITGVYPGANYHEREVWDMFGVKFDGHPDLRRILMPYDWIGHPQRKDYPLGYEEVQFSFNHERIQAQKPQPKE